MFARSRDKSIEINNYRWQITENLVYPTLATRANWESKKLKKNNSVYVNLEHLEKSLKQAKNETRQKQ